MTTGKIEYAPDYKSEKEPRLPKNFGLMETVCADGQHRFLPDAPKCGCGKTINRAVELARLERKVIEAVKRFRQNDIAMTRYWERRASDAEYDPDSSALFTLVNNSNRKELYEAVDALLQFESQQK